MPGLFIKISGQVQGVGCRYRIKDYCDRHNLTGWVKNLPDGRVEAAIYSLHDTELQNFLNWLKFEAGFVISNIESNSQEGISNFKDFNIIFK